MSFCMTEKGPSFIAWSAAWMAAAASGAFAPIFTNCCFCVASIFASRRNTRGRSLATDLVNDNDELRAVRNTSCNMRFIKSLGKIFNATQFPDALQTITLASANFTFNIVDSISFQFAAPKNDSGTPYNEQFFFS